MTISKALGDGLVSPEPAPEGIRRESPDAAYYTRLVRRGTPKLKAKRMSGYSEKTRHDSIIRTKVAKYAMSNIAEAREAVQSTPGQTFLDNAEVLTEIRDDTAFPANTRVAAIKEHNSMNGYNAPQEINQKSTALIVELQGFGPDELLAIAKGEVKI